MVFAFTISLHLVSGSDAKEAEETKEAILKEATRLGSICNTDKFTPPKFPRNSLAPTPPKIDTPLYLKAYERYLKNFKKIRWFDLFKSLKEKLSEQQRRKVLKDIAAAYVPIYEEVMLVDIEKVKAANGEIPKELKESPYKLAKTKFLEYENDPKKLVINELLGIPLEFPEKIVYNLMCGLKDVIEYLIFNIKDHNKNTEDKTKVIDERVIEDLKSLLKIADGMRKETGPITIKLWFWLLMAFLIVFLILVGVFVFYYFRR
jgi:hypothetical protein